MVFTSSKIRMRAPRRSQDGIMDSTSPSLHSNFPRLNNVRSGLAGQWVKTTEWIRHSIFPQRHYKPQGRRVAARGRWRIDLSKVEHCWRTWANRPLLKPQVGLPQ